MSTTPAPAPFTIVPLPKAGEDKFNELLYAKKFEKKAPKIRTQGDQWYAWDGKAWRLQPRESFRQMAMEVLPNQHKIARHAKALLDHVEYSRQLGHEEKLRGALCFDATGAVLINLANGVLRVNADTIELLKHDPDYLFTGALSAEWKEDAQAELFKRVMSEALPDAGDRDLLQWFAGYMLFPDSKQHEVFLMCFGEAGTGKSTIAEAVLAVLGAEPLVTALSMAQICGSGPAAYSLPKLQHAVVNLGTELDTVELDDSANFKRVVSGETIEARTIYGRPFPMRTTAKLWFLANSLPRFKHGTEAELRRSRFILFDQKRENDKKDTTLKDRLPLESSGVLRWMVMGLVFILNGVPCPLGGEKSRRVKDKFAVSNDPVNAFVKQCCILDPNGEEPKSVVYGEFNEFLDGWGFAEQSKKYLFSALFQRVPQLTSVRYREGNTQRKEPGRYIRGLTIRDDD